jgi:hypothetical protein
MATPDRCRECIGAPAAEVAAAVTATDAVGIKAVGASKSVHGSSSANTTKSLTPFSFRANGGGSTRTVPRAAVKAADGAVVRRGGVAERWARDEGCTCEDERAAVAVNTGDPVGEKAERLVEGNRCNTDDEPTGAAKEKLRLRPRPTPTLLLPLDAWLDAANEAKADMVARVAVVGRDAAAIPSIGEDNTAGPDGEGVRTWARVSSSI